jgi:hypothetical protein
MKYLLTDVVVVVVVVVVWETACFVKHCMPQSTKHTVPFRITGSSQYLISDT